MIQKWLQNKNLQALLLHGGIAAFGFLNFMLLSRMLAPIHLGEWVLFIAISSFAEVVRTGWVVYPLVRLRNSLPPQELLKLRQACTSIGAMAIFALSVVSICIYFFVKSNNSWQFIFLGIPILLLCSFPMYDAIWEGQATQNFFRILFLRLMVFGGFFLWLCFLFFTCRTIPLKIVAIVYMSLHAFASAVAFFQQWTTPAFWKGFHNHFWKQALREGKYSMGSMMNLSLLKTSDTFLIGWFAGNYAVAMYGVPLKLTEIADIIQRSFASNAFPELSTLNDQYTAKWKRITVYLFLFFCIYGLLGWLFTDEILVLTAGNAYLNETTRTVWHILLLWQILLPLERMSGIWLETRVSVRTNYWRTLLMLFTNVTGDIFVLTYLKNWVYVAWVSVGVLWVSLMFGIVQNLNAK
ncbi:MAG: hypothetical protein NZM38_10025 [Cytophagales bacterium]|nr:hypothetical protein [Cytophagales bacterium]MDW8385092.1 hypothetical protein [Flammeovirgaceae bacterium]